MRFLAKVLETRKAQRMYVFAAAENNDRFCNSAQEVEK